MYGYTVVDSVMRNHMIRKGLARSWKTHRKTHQYYCDGWILLCT